MAEKRPNNPAGKKAARKKHTAKRADTTALVVPAHPLMINGKDWNREKVMDVVCDGLATSSRGLGSILKAGYLGRDLPSYSTVMKWLEEDQKLSDKYARAKEAQADYMADEMLDIADNGAEETVEVDGKQVKAKTNAGVNHARLRVETRKWLAGKLRPKKYGERIEMEHSGSIQTVPDEKVDERIEALMAKTKAK